MSHQNPQSADGGQVLVKDALNAEILECQAQAAVNCPEMTKYFDEFALIHIVENTGEIEPHNLSAFLERIEAMVEGYTGCVYPIANA